MTIKEAINIVTKEFPGYKVVGYWDSDDGYILNTVTTESTAGMIAPGQFVVTNDGKTYGTNPMRHNLDISKMKKI